MMFMPACTDRTVTTAHCFTGQGFPGSDVLTEFDMDSGNFKDKETKVAYLTKIIGAVASATGPLQVKPLNQDHVV